MGYATMDGDIETLDRTLHRSLQEGQASVAILRAVSRHLLRLHFAAGRVAGGEPADRAMKALRPPVFFKRQGQFRRQLTTWRTARIARALDIALAAERGCSELISTGNGYGPVMVDWLPSRSIR